MPDMSSRLGRLPGYPLAGVPEIRRKLRSQGMDVIDLGAGDADFAPPPAAVDALREAALDPDMSRYPFQLGLPALREGLAEWMAARFGVRLDPFAELLPLIGSKEGIGHLAFAFLEEGDVSIVPDPGYQAYVGGTVLAGGEPYRVPLRPENGFLVPVDDLPPDVVARAKLLYLNYPNNPTTASAPREYLRSVVEFCHRHDLVLIFDNAYSEVAYNGYRPPSVLELDGAREVAVEFHSFSKTYNMTGWRLGWAAGSADLVRTLSRVKSFLDTGAYLGVQAGGLAALKSYQDWVPGNVARFQARRDAAVEAFRGAGFDVKAPQATMYLWIPVPGGEPSEAFAMRILEEAGVVILPGRALGEGGEGFFRIALTVAEERLAEAADRMGSLRA